MSGPRRAQDRVQRLLVMLPWLMEVGEVSLDEVARRFALRPAEVERDLELVAMCGLPPFVDEMVDVFVDDGMVYVGVPRLFTRPLRLTAPEAFSLLTAARAAMQLPGADPDGPLGRGLAKLGVALADAGVEPADATAGVVVELARPELVDVVADAVATGAELTIAHYSAVRDELGERTIVPRHVFAESGNWYVRADDGRSGESRVFRVDRIEWARPTGRTVPPEQEPSPPGGFFVDADVERVRLSLAPNAQWILERYPVDEVSAPDGDGWVVATLPVSGERWLAKVLLRLGPDARVEGPGATDVRAAAERILARYA